MINSTFNVFILVMSIFTSSQAWAVPFRVLVTDEHGARANMPVEVHHEALGQTFSGVTNESGIYDLGNISAGMATISTTVGSRTYSSGRMQIWPTLSMTYQLELVNATDDSTTPEQWNHAILDALAVFAPPLRPLDPDPEIVPTTGPGYLGCYTDSGTRALPDYLGTSYATIESCKEAARARGHVYAGLQQGNQCYGGSNLLYTKVDDSECSVPCAGNPGQLCGGNWRNSAYATGIPRKAELLIDAGSQGLFRVMDGLPPALLHPMNPKHVATGDLDGSRQDELIVDFGSVYGVWVLWNNQRWAQLHPMTSNGIAVGDLDASGRKDLVIDFPGFGIYAYMNAASWVYEFGMSTNQKIVTVDTDGGGDEVFVSIPDRGLWRRSSSTRAWTQFHAMNPLALGSGDFDGNGRGDLVASFSGWGGYIHMNGTSWTQFHGFAPDKFTAADYDGVPGDELVMDFGREGWGIWVYSPRSGGWNQLHTMSCRHMASGDLNGDGRSELVFDFGDVWSLQGQSWNRIHAGPTEGLAVGHMN